MSSSSESPTRKEAVEWLRRLVQDPAAAFHAGQWEAIEALVADRRRALVVQRTGWGKSAVYFIATAMLRARGAGPTVIISPLLALMRNQIAAAERAGIHAVTVNSTNVEQWDEVHASIADGEVDVLLVSPERLNNPGFRDEVLPRLAATCGLLVVDEAHCISDWGHDFRPDYRRLRTLLAELPGGIPVLATTATANARVTRDVAEQLGRDTLVQRGSLERESLRLSVVRLPTPEQRLAWLVEFLRRTPGSGIVYCLTVAATQEVAAFLSSRGLSVAAYSGQTEAGERLGLEDDLLSGRVKALVATSALGMGFDARLGFVVNLGAPQSPVAYYQQVGRAGRGTDDAAVVLLPQVEDRDIWRYFSSLGFPGEDVVRQTLGALGDAGRPVSTAELETWIDLSRNRLEMMLKVLDVDGAVRRVRGGWESTGEAWEHDAERYERVRRAREVEQQAMLDYLDTDGCRLEFLRRQLDDPDAAACGRCDNCTGVDPVGEVDPALAEAAAERLARPGVPVDPRKMWPTALANLGLTWKGRIGEGADEGRALGRLTDTGVGADLRALFRPGTPDGPVPLPLVQAALRVLDDWQPQVDGIVVVESWSRPTLVQDFADGVSRRLGVPVVATWAVVDPDVPPGAGASNSAQRVAAVQRRSALRGADDLTGRRLLLVDDLVVSGWSLTLAARAVREAGAAAVLPLVLAAQS